MTDLNGSRPLGENPGATVPGVPLQIDRNIDFQSANDFSDLLIGFRSYIDEPVKRTFQSPANLRMIAWTERDCGRLETRAVMCFKQTRHEIGGGMLMQIG